MDKELLLKKVNAVLEENTGNPILVLKHVKDYLESEDEHSDKFFPPRVDMVEIRWPTYFVCDHDVRMDRKFDLVKWTTHPPQVIFDLKLGRDVVSTESCYSLGFLEWDDKNRNFTFKGCGLRIFETEISEDAKQMILDFCEKMRRQYNDEDFSE